MVGEGEKGAKASRKADAACFLAQRLRLKIKVAGTMQQRRLRQEATQRSRSVAGTRSTHPLAGCL